MISVHKIPRKVALQENYRNGFMAECKYVFTMDTYECKYVITMDTTECKYVITMDITRCSFSSQSPSFTYEQEQVEKSSE